MTNDSNMADIEHRFGLAMWAIYKNALSDCRYNAHYFHQMLEDHGGLETARRLLSSSNIQYGFTKLWKCGRLDLTVEAHVLKPEYKALFTEEEQMEARRRLEEYDYRFDT